MSLKHGMLGLLNYGSMTGYELNAVFKDSLSFFWQAQTSQIYRELKKMEQLGWLTSEQILQKDKPNKNVYTITELGKSELNKWLSTPEKDMHDALNVRSAFLMRVFFSGEMDSGQTLAMIRAFRNECLEAIQALEGVDGVIANYGRAVDSTSKTKYWKLTALFGESYYRAILEWTEKAIAILEEKE